MLNSTKRLSTKLVDIRNKVSSRWHDDQTFDGTVRSYLEKYIGELEKSHAIEATTVVNYRHTSAQICSVIGDLKLNQVKASDIMTMQSTLLNEVGLCSNTVIRCHRFLKQVMQYAVDEGALLTTPFNSHLKAPKRTFTEPNALTDESRIKLLAALDEASDSPYSLAIRCALATGMRREEICGLRWCDLSQDCTCAHIMRAIACADGKMVIKGPKTPTSRRDVPIDDAVAKKLLNRRNCIEVEPDQLKQLYVFGDAEGNFMKPETLSKEFRSLARELDLKGVTGKAVTFHDLRHTFATMLISRGVDVKTVANILGHSNPSITLRVYTASDPQARANALSIIDKVMAERPEKTSS